MVASSLEARLPQPRALERRCVALAMLDAVLCREWEWRYYSFNRHWNAAMGLRMGSMRNGEGDEWFALFFADGRAAIKGWAKNAEAREGLSVPGVLDGIPDDLGAFTGEPAFTMNQTTFCLWNVDGTWRRSPSLSADQVAHDGSGGFLALLVGDAGDYAEFARDYFEKDVAKATVARFFLGEPLTPELVAALGPSVSYADLATDIDEIGYPIESGA